MALLSLDAFTLFTMSSCSFLFISLCFYKDVEQPEPTGTLYIRPDPKRFILEGGKVKTENRGIFTNPAKNNKHLIPNEYFSFYYADDATEERIKTLGEKDIKDKLNKVKESWRKGNLRLWGSCEEDSKTQ